MDETDIIQLIIGVLVIGGVFWICVPSIPPTPERKEPEMSDCPQPVMAYKDDKGRLHITLADAQASNRAHKRSFVLSEMRSYVRQVFPPWFQSDNSDAVVLFLDLNRRRIEQFYRELDEVK